MAKKKKQTSKRRQQRKQKKQQRRKARVRNQSSGGSSAPRRNDGGQVAAITRSPLLEDALPLFPLVEDASALPPEAVYEGFMLAALDTTDLIDEPEFADIMPDPMLTSVLFIKYAEEAGYDADTFFSLEADEREDVFWEALEQVVEEALTDELRSEILAAVDALRLRWKRDSRHQDDVPRVAALQMMLEVEGEQTFWYGTGLVQAIFQRSVNAGFELSGAMLELTETDGDSSPFPSDALSEEKLLQMTERLQKTPGLEKYLDKQADAMWETGMHGSFMGELDLAIFSDDEIDGGAAIWDEVAEQVENELDLDADDEDDQAVLFPTTAERAIPLIYDYVDGVFATPERRAKLAEHLNQARQQHQQSDSEWVPFVMLVHSYARDEPEYLLDSGYLMRAFMGEMRNRVFDLAETEDGEEDGTEEETGEKKAEDGEEAA